MSLVLYGGGIIDQRGSVNGNTFSRSRFGATMRAKTSPVNPNSYYSSQRRTTLQYLSGSWSKDLTDAERAAWNTFALSNPLTNVFGNTSYVSGQNWYIKLNSNILLVGGSMITSPPASATAPPPTSISLNLISGSPSTLGVDWTPSGGTGTPRTIVWLTPMLSPGVSYANSKLKYIVQVADSPGVLDCIDEWLARYGGDGLTAGKKIIALVLSIQKDTGAQSAGTFVSGIVS